MNETFVASNPKNAYMQAVDKYGTEIMIVSAKQVQYDNEEIRSEVVISVPKKLFMEKSFGIQNLEAKSEEEVLLGEIGELKNQLEEMREGLLHLGRFGTVAEDIKKRFIQKGISERWLDSVLLPLIGTPVMEDATLLVSYLLEEIDEVLQVKEEDFTHSKIVMLVGPTGVGKTTTLAKLAARYAYLIDKPCKVALINLDTYKVGASEQLEHYADIMQIEYYSVTSPEAFKERVEMLEGYDVILVDTAGISPYDTEKFIKTVAFVVTTEIPKKIEVNLVVSATVKYEDMEDIYENFSFLNLNSVIISKFDETKHFGTLMNFMLLYDVPMSYFSTGQEVPDDLRVASKEYLLEHFIGDVHED